MKRLSLILCAIGFAVSPVYAHQPVMDMAPRWSDGYGFQVRYDQYGSDDLFDGDSEIDNPLGLERYVERTWLEGVYTFDRAYRVTLKAPIINQRRTTLLDGRAVRQKNDGLGDIILGVPLKLYRNVGGFTRNFSLTPSLRMPTGSTSGDFPLSDGSWDAGLSLSYSSETPTLYQLWDVYYWLNSNGTDERREGNELGLDINIGVHPLHDMETQSGMFVMLDVTGRSNERGDALTTGASGGERLTVGPVLVLYRQNIMFRTEYRFPVYENMDGVSLSRGDEFSIGIGVTF